MYVIVVASMIPAECSQKAGNYKCRNVCAALVPHPSFSLLLHRHPFVSFLPHTYTRNQRTPHTRMPPVPTPPYETKEREGTDNKKWIPLSSAGGEGMDHVTLGVGCAFFGIMIGHFQVWLARHVIPPFPRPNTDVPASPHAKLHKEDNICELRARTPGCVVLETEWMDATSLIEALPQHANTIILD